MTSLFNFKVFDAPLDDVDVDWSKPSKAVVVVGEAGGCVLFSAGPHLDSLMHDAGLSDLSDLGLDDAPDGISIWEGVVKGRRYETVDGYEYESDTVGSFRAPTDEEWASLRRNECPWDVTYWKKP